MSKATLRRCIACRKSCPPTELLRVVFEKGRGLQIEAGQRLCGRGAYIHPTLLCWRGGLDSRRWERALRISPGDLSDRDFVRFKEELSSCLKSENVQEDRAEDNVKGGRKKIRF